MTQLQGEKDKPNQAKERQRLAICAHQGAESHHSEGLLPAINTTWGERANGPPCPKRE